MTNNQKNDEFCYVGECKKQDIEEMQVDLMQSLVFSDKGVKCGDSAKNLYDKGYAKRRIGKWVFESHTFYDDYGDLIVYATGKCSECGKNYHGNSTIVTQRYERPEDIMGDEHWEVDTKPLRENILEKAKHRKDLLPHCPYCGAEMKGEIVNG